MRITLKKARERKGFKQEDVAKLSGISRSYYTNIEIGVKTPSIPVAKRIAHVLGIDWTYFFEEKCSSREHSKEVS
ncbi:transcriptional regulator [Caldibacillus phage CBP1]|uniref:Putative transcriptional regulator n=1 Tax=Caldibacillus debilis GB1 TaxID=1339248 RepID=A0A420VIT0_9BACI|nr:helix-turn-helix transcriptional regulator [Caldibacillus debilis]ATB52697.1 transcriptional regulator [Caldibacillus phage CBP1]RKO63525.1 putative transcriptional regulator [Caldibacillus debilis GB1]